MSARLRPLACVLLLAVLTACAGLPLPNGVRDAGARGDEADAGGIVVVAPGPQPGMTATQLVAGFLEALSRSPQDDHAIARQFLAPGVECCGEDEEAVLYAVGARRVSLTPDPAVVRVTYDSVGRILRDGSYRVEDLTVVDDFRVEDVDGEARLAGVPRGLRLVQDDLERSFTPNDVHFLGRSSDGSASGRLVPDRVFLPAQNDPDPAEPGQALVDALLSGPTLRLAPAVLSAAPAGTTARVRASGGVATVDLSAQVRELDARARQRLSAQLVWTLVPTYSGVRLLVEGTPFTAGAGTVQDLSDWETYDPVGASGNARLLYLQDRRLRLLDRELPDSPVSNGELPVDGVAQSPSTGQLAVRTRRSEQLHEVRTGPLRGPFGDPVLAAPGLTSLSWGPVEQGLWVLQPGPAPVVWLVPEDEAADRTPQRVALSPPPGELTALEVSRDGARIALVLGGRLHVGRVEPTGPLPGGVPGWRISDVRLVSDELLGVTDVAWQSGTSLVALGSDEVDGQLFPAEVAVDGSSLDVVQRPLVGAVAVEIAAAPGEPLVVAAEVQGESRLFRDDGTLFRQEGPGSSPAYPG